MIVEGNLSDVLGVQSFDSQDFDPDTWDFPSVTTESIAAAKRARTIDGLCQLAQRCRTFKNLDIIGDYAREHGLFTQKLGRAMKQANRRIYRQYEFCPMKKGMKKGSQKVLVLDGRCQLTGKHVRAIEQEGFTPI